MVTEITVIDEQDPGTMEPGELYCETEPVRDEPENPDDAFFGMLSCPKCGATHRITLQQFAGTKPTMCTYEGCDAYYFIVTLQPVKIRKVVVCKPV